MFNIHYSSTDTVRGGYFKLTDIVFVISIQPSTTKGDKLKV